MAAYFECHIPGSLKTFLEVLSLPLQASDNNQVRRAVSLTLPNHPEGAGDRARQSELLQEKHSLFQEAIGRATESYEAEIAIRKKGCQLAFLAQRIREHYNDKEKRSNNISTRLIGEQAISLARYSYRLIDALGMEDDSGPQKIQRWPSVSGMLELFSTRLTPIQLK